MLRQPGDGGPGRQRIKGVQTAFASRCPETGEVVVADMRPDAIPALVTGPCVIHRDPAGGLQTRLSNAPASLTNSSCPTISGRSTCRFGMLMRIAASSAVSCGTVT
jgi:hypothetical protein